VEVSVVEVVAVVAVVVAVAESLSVAGSPVLVAESELLPADGWVVAESEMLPPPEELVEAVSVPAVLVALAPALSSVVVSSPHATKRRAVARA